MVSLASQHGVQLSVENDYRTPRDSKGNMLDPIISLRSVSVSGPLENYPVAAEEVRRGMRPAAPEAIEGWLAELSVIVAKRQDDDFTETLRLEAYTKRLMEYPADVVRHALVEKTWRFWPSWDELKPECERLVAPRRAMLRALLNPKAEEDQRGPRCAAETADEIVRQAGFSKRVGGAA